MPNANYLDDTTPRFCSIQSMYMYGNSLPPYIAMAGRSLNIFV